MEYSRFKAGRVHYTNSAWEGLIKRQWAKQNKMADCGNTVNLPCYRSVPFYALWAWSLQLHFSSPKVKQISTLLFLAKQFIFTNMLHLLWQSFFGNVPLFKQNREVSGFRIVSTFRAIFLDDTILNYTHKYKIQIDIYSLEEHQTFGTALSA